MVLAQDLPCGWSQDVSQACSHVNISGLKALPPGWFAHMRSKSSGHVDLSIRLSESPPSWSLAFPRVSEPRKKKTWRKLWCLRCVSEATQSLLPSPLKRTISTFWRERHRIIVDIFQTTRVDLSANWKKERSQKIMEQAWVWILPLPFTSSVTLGELLTSLHLFIHEMEMPIVHISLAYSGS